MHRSQYPSPPFHLFSLPSEPCRRTHRRAQNALSSKKKLGKKILPSLLLEFCPELIASEAPSRSPLSPPLPILFSASSSAVNPFPRISVFVLRSALLVVGEKKKTFRNDNVGRSAFISSRQFSGMYCEKGVKVDIPSVRPLVTVILQFFFQGGKESVGGCFNFCADLTYCNGSTFR